MLTREYLKECIHYDPETGDITWATRPRHHFVVERWHRGWNTRYSGKPFGSLDGKGYLFGSIDTQSYRAHRLAWLYMTGVLLPPNIEVDHINHKPLDNRWVNLRAVTRSENSRNQSISTRNTSGVTGVYFNKRIGKWCAQMKFKRHVYHLGSFKLKEAAIKARKLEEVKLGFHQNHGGTEC